MQEIEILKSFGIVGGLLIILVLFLVGIVKTLLGNERKEFRESLKTMQNNQLEIVKTIKDVRNRMNDGYLNKHQTRMMYNQTMINHKYEKLEFLRNVFIVNNIHNRIEEIKNNIRDTFRRITNEGVEFLSEFGTPAGNLGDIICNELDFDSFVENDIFPVVFSDASMDTKLKDIEINMDIIISNIKVVIEKKMRDSYQ